MAILVCHRPACGTWISSVLWLIWAQAVVPAAEVSPPASQQPALLTGAQQVLVLSLDAARQSLVPVRLQGLVTYPDPAAHIVYVQDASAGIRVVYTNGDYQPAVGQLVVVEGTAASGMFAPFVDCASVRVIGSAAIPEPCEASAARMVAGELFGQWVQVEGVVRDVAKDPEIGRAHV